MWGGLDSHVSYGSVSQFQVFQKTDDNERVVYTGSNTWFLRTNHVTSNGGNNPSLQWSSYELEPRVSCKILSIWQLVMAWVYRAFSFQSLYPRWVMSISKFSKNHHYLLMKRYGRGERSWEHQFRTHYYSPAVCTHHTHFAYSQIVRSSDVFFWKAWRVFKLSRFETEFRILLLKLVLLRCSPSQWIFPPSTSLFLMLHIHPTAVIGLLHLLCVSGIYSPPCLSSHDPSSSYHHPTSYLISPWKGFPSSSQLRLVAHHNSGHVTRSNSSVASSLLNQAHNPAW